MKNIQKLSQNSARLISSSNIITSVFSAVKELVENSIDGEATSIEVKLENCGLDRIEVRDNGCGIEQCDVSCVAKAHCTSKLTSHLDLDQLETYGFRGEALSALCSMANLSITTKTINDDISQTYSFSKSGDITTSNPSSSPCGTVVVAINLFKDIPVRKKYYKSEKCKKEELKKIEDLLCAYSCAQMGTRFALYHNKSLVWQKSSSTDMKAVLIQVFGNSVVSNFEHRTFKAEEIKINAHLPKISAPILSLTRAQCDRSIVIINKRPVLIKAIHKLVQETYYQSVNHGETRNRFPVFLLDITVPPSKLDVNVDPNKTQVLLHNFETFLSTLSEFLQTCFSKTETGIHIANSALANGNGETQLLLPSVSDTQLHLKSVSSNADSNPSSETNGNKSQCFEVQKPGIFSGESLTKRHTDTIDFEADKLISHSTASDLTGVNSLTYDLVNQMISKPTPKLQTSSKSDDTSTLQTNPASDTLTSKVVFQKEPSVSNGREDHFLIVDHINLIRKDNETVERRPHAGGLFTRNVCSMELYDNNPKFQTKLNTNEQTGTLKCQIDDGVLPKKKNIEKHPSSGLSTNAIESVSKNLLKDGNMQKFLNGDFSIDRVKCLSPLETHHTPQRAFPEQNPKGSLSLSKNADSVLNSCRKNSVNTNKNNLAPNFPQLKELFTQPVVPKASSFTPHQQVPTITNPNNVNINEGNIVNGISSCEPPKSTINSSEPLISVVNTCEPQKTAINLCELLQSTANFCEPSKSPINSSKPPRLAMNSSESNKNHDPGQNNSSSNNDWSFGKMPDNSGKTLQPVSILAPSPTKRSRAASSESPEGSKKKKLSLVKESAAEVPKNPTGFEYFCRSARLGVQGDHPEFSNQEIAQVLYQQWKILPPEKKIVFKELAIKQYRKIVKPKKQLSNTLCQAVNKSKRSNEEPNDLPDSQGRIRKKGKEAKLNFVLEDLKTLCATTTINLSKDDDSRKLTPIKALSSGIWLCLQEENLILLNSYRMKETLIYHRLLNTYQLKPETLETPLNLNSELIIDPECWQVLTTIYSENANALSHASLTGNGFNVRAIKNNIELSFEVIGIATCVPSYGIHDLQEILRIIRVKGFSVPLAEYRPAKIKHYLQSEAVRIGRQSLAIQRQDEFTDLLKQSQKYLPLNTSECFHGKPFQHCIFNMSSLLTECTLDQL